MLKKLFVVVLSFLLLFTPLQVEGATFQEPNLNDYLEFDSFQKRYGEHAANVAYYYSVAYGSNEHYFKENMSMWSDALSSTLGDNSWMAKGMEILDQNSDYLAKPVAFLSATVDTGGNLASKLFNKIKGFFSSDTYPELDIARENNRYISPTGTYFQVEGFEDPIYAFESISLSMNSNRGISVMFSTSYASQVRYIGYIGFDEKLTNKAQRDKLAPFVDLYSLKPISVNEFFDLWYTFNNPNITLKRFSDKSEVSPTKIVTIPQPIERTIDNIVNNINNYPKDYTIDSVQPQLVCPNYDVNLQFDNGTFKTKQGQIITLDANEKTTFNNETCSLDFVFPQIEYDDETNKLVVGGNDLSPVIPVDPIDMGILDYIRNSYNYAVTAVQTGVHGLETVTKGFVGITALAGSVFGFLPPEITNYILGAFLISIGLWVVKK